MIAVIKGIADNPFEQALGIRNPGDRVHFKAPDLCSDLKVAKTFCNLSEIKIIVNYLVFLCRLYRHYVNVNRKI